MAKLGVRWTIGDVSGLGFEALRFSIWGAWRLFGDRARYVVCVNTVSAREAAHRTGTLPHAIAWSQVGRSDVAPVVATRLDDALAEGVGWKFAPLRVFHDLPELALDNDCILWSLPDAMRVWLEDPRPSALVAADVRPCFGRFAAICGDEPRNSGIRGLPAGFDLGGALRRILSLVPGLMSSELDEQGLQMAALARALPLRVVGTDDVAICSPFPPHAPTLGRCGAHFVGLNSKGLPWSYEGRPASDLTREHYLRHRSEIARRLDVPEPAAA